MGNFRHQSIRTTDRAGDKDLDRERERDLRDREGQERLRNVSLTGSAGLVTYSSQLSSSSLTSTTVTALLFRRYPLFATRSVTPPHISLARLLHGWDKPKETAAAVTEETFQRENRVKVVITGGQVCVLSSSSQHAIPIYS